MFKWNFQGFFPNFQTLLHQLSKIAFYTRTGHLMGRKHWFDTFFQKTNSNSKCRKMLHCSLMFKASHNRWSTSTISLNCGKIRKKWLINFITTKNISHSQENRIKIYSMCREISTFYFCLHIIKIKSQCHKCML